MFHGLVGRTVDNVSLTPLAPGEARQTVVTIRFTDGSVLSLVTERAATLTLATPSGRRSFEWLPTGDGR